MNEDRFADVLDAMVRGTAPRSDEPPADIARRLQEMTTDRLDSDRRSAIWHDLMTTHGRNKQTTGGPGPLAQPALTAPDAFNPWARRRVPPASARRRMEIVHEAMQTGIAAMAIVAIVIAAFVAFPIIRGDDATPSVTPTARAAAPTQPTGNFGAQGTSGAPEPPEAPPTILPSGSEKVVGQAATGGDRQNAPGGIPTVATMVTASTPSAAYHHPHPADCKGKPLTPEEVMRIAEGGSSDRLPATSLARSERRVTEEEYRQITDSHRTWLACHFGGTALQMLALESDDMVRAEILQANLPAYSPSLVAEQIASLPSSPEVGTTAFTWEPPTDTFIPMIADWDPSTAPMVDETGRVTIPVIWMNRDGDTIPGPDTPMASDLPLHWTYIWSEASGRWLLDSYEP